MSIITTPPKKTIAAAIERAFQSEQSYPLPFGIRTYSGANAEIEYPVFNPGRLRIHAFGTQILLLDEIEKALAAGMKDLIVKAQLGYDIETGEYGHRHLTHETVTHLKQKVEMARYTPGVGDSPDVYSKVLLESFATNGDSRLWNYNGKCWKCVGDIDAKSKTARLIDKCGGTLKKAEKATMVNDLIVALADPIPPQQDGINVDNGFLEIENGAWTLRPHDRDHGQVNCLPFSFNPNARCYRWILFLEEVQPDPAVRRFLQEIFGFILLGKLRPHLERFFVFHGTGQNGKSVTLEILSMLIGEANISRLSMDKFEPRNLEMLVGKLVNLGSETEHSTKMSTSVFKQAVSREPLLAEPKYRGHYHFTSHAALLFAVNAMPAIDDRSDGIWRRMALVPWPVTIEKPDTDLKHTLAKEMPGILNWALEGALRVLTQRRLSDPPSVQEAGAQLRTENNSVALFVGECAVIDPRHRITKQDAYDAYVIWSRRCGYKTMSKHNFGREISRVLGPMKSACKTYFPYWDIHRTEQMSRRDAYPFFIPKGLIRRSFWDSETGNKLEDFDGQIGQDPSFADDKSELWKRYKEQRVINDPSFANEKAAA